MLQPPRHDLHVLPKPVSPVARALGERRLAVQRNFFDAVVLSEPKPAALSRWQPGRLARLWARGFAQALPSTAAYATVFIPLIAGPILLIWPELKPAPLAWLNHVRSIVGGIFMLGAADMIFRNNCDVANRMHRLGIACRDDLLETISPPLNLIALSRDRSEQYNTRALRAWTRAQDAVHAGHPRRAANQFEACMRLAIAAGDDFRVVEDCGMLAGLSAYLGGAPRLAASLLRRNAHTFSVHNAPYATLRARLLSALCAADRTPSAVMSTWHSMRLRIGLADVGEYLAYLLQHLGSQRSDAAALFDQLTWLQRLPGARRG